MSGIKVYYSPSADAWVVEDGNMHARVLTFGEWVMWKLFSIKPERV